jgi:PAS domain-containing protein
MAHKEIELILTRQLADSLAMPVFLVEVDDTLVFYNEPAEKIFGSRFEETGPLSSTEWRASLVPVDHDGKALEVRGLPVTTALTHRRPAHSSFRLRGMDRVIRSIEVTAVPLVGRGDRFLGVVVFLWEAKPE